MIQKIGGRKTIWLTEAFICFWAILYTLNLTDANVIVAVWTGIAALIGAAIYGNIREWQSKNGKSE
jgi:hypothetical protein